MRSDMKRLIGDKRGSRIAGPRKGKRFSPAEFRKHDWDIDDAPFVAGIVGHGLEKSLIGLRRTGGRGFTRKPLERYLSSQVGNTWDSILSDIRTALRKADAAEAHWPILTGLVAVRTKTVDDEVMVENCYGNLIALSDKHAPKFYVDPQNGRLSRNTSIETHRMRQKRIAAAKSAELATRMRDISDTCQLHLLSDGNWWEVTLIEHDWRRVGVCNPPEDVVIKSGLTQLPRDTLYGRPFAFATAKRPLSSREIRRYGLRTR